MVIQDTHELAKELQETSRNIKKGECSTSK